MTSLKLMAALILASCIQVSDISARQNQEASKAISSIDQLPHFEDFNGVETPDLPAGWTAIVKSGNPNAFLETATTGSPVSPPNHVRAFNSSDSEATLFLVTPEIMHPMNDMRVRFYAHANTGAGNVLEVGTIDMDGDEELHVVESISLTNEYTDYMVTFDDYDGDNSYIAFKAIPEANFRNIYIDNVTLEAIPTAGVAEVSPPGHDFGTKQVNMTWPPKDFTITNVGVADLTIGPDDIAITGDDAGDFLLHNLESATTLEPFETTTIGVSFSAQSIGEKSAVLNVDATEVPLTGEATDHTITEFPHFEDFNDATMPDLPHGWTDHVESFNPAARIETTDISDPVSPPQQLRFLNMNDPDALLLFISPPLDTDMSELRIRFHAKALSGTDNAVELGSYDHEAEDSFTPLELITISTTHTEYQVDLDDYTGSDTHLAFRAVPEQSVRPIYFDNLEIDLIPTDAVIEIEPETHEFPPTHYGEISDSQSFIITNTGGASITLHPEDIEMGGDDAAQFMLENISDPVTLETNDTTSVSVTFAPDVPGYMEALLLVEEAESQLAGLSYDPTITDLPHLEDFNSLDAPQLPFGWFTYIQSTAANADIETSELSDPNSPPNHVRFRNFQDEDAELILITAPIAHDLQNLRLRFYAKCNIAGNHTMEVGTYDPDTEVFNMLESFSLTTDYTNFIYDLDDYDGDDDRIAFRANQGQAHRFIMLDDVTIEFSPDMPIILVSPDSHDFEPLQKGFTSEPKTFTISNDGGGMLHLAPGDIMIGGTDAGAFLLDNLEDAVELETGETATIQVFFAPQATGQKEATLFVDDFEVSLSGEAYDATITDFPWEEDFSGIPEDTIPFGWMRDTENWRVVDWDHAGGEAPELEFYFVPAHTGISYLKSPLLNTSDFNQMLLSFRHAVNNYEDPGDYTLRVVTIDGDGEYLIDEWIDPDDMAAEHLEYALTADDHGIGSENLQLAFVFEGESFDINRWSIDDIQLRDMPEFSTLHFLVYEDGPEQTPMEGVIINMEGMPAITTDEDGQASIELEHDTYDATILKPGYVTQEITFTLDQDKTIEIAMQDVIVTPTDLQVTTEDLAPGQALFSWTMEEVFHEFRYDDGEVNNQMGFPHGNINSVLGAAHHHHAVLHELTWLLTEEGGPHQMVDVWVTGLDEDGLPDQDQILYHAAAVNNVDNQWNTYEFSEPIQALDGFFIGVSYNGFLGLALDDGEGEPWEFTPGTQFGIFNITDPDAEFTDIADWGAEQNFLIRAYGDNLGAIDYRNARSHLAGVSGPIATFGDSDPQEISPDHPRKEQLLINRAFSGFHIYLGDMQNPVAEYIGEQEFLFEELDEGTYNAGVQALYTTGESEIATLDFAIEDGFVMHYTATFEVQDPEDGPIDDAVVTLNGITGNPGEYVFDGLEAGTYEYTVSKEGYMDATGQFEITNEDVTLTIVMEVDDVSVTEADSDAMVLVYPNPATERLTIEAGQDMDKIRIFNLTGQQVYENKPGQSAHQIDIGHFEEGIYIIRVYAGNKLIHRQVTISY